MLEELYLYNLLFLRARLVDPEFSRLQVCIGDDFFASRDLIIDLIWFSILFLANKAFDSVLLNLNIDTSLCDSHDNASNVLFFDIRLRVKELESVELNTCHRGKLSHSILTIHLVTLFREFELVCHIVVQRGDVDSSGQKTVN